MGQIILCLVSIGVYVMKLRSLIIQLKCRNPFKGHGRVLWTNMVMASLGAVGLQSLTSGVLRLLISLLPSSVFYLVLL